MTDTFTNDDSADLKLLSKGSLAWYPIADLKMACSYHFFNLRHDLLIRSKSFRPAAIG